jgi:hypothetical protein
VRTFVSLIAAVAVTATASASAAAPSLSIAASGSRVLYGHELTLSGRISSGRAGKTVVVVSRPYGLPAARIATVKTGPRGGWSVRIGPAVDTTYQARSGSTVSAPVFVGVEPAIAVRVLGSGIRSHVSAGTTLAGRSLQLQQVSGAGWATIARAAIDGNSNALFQPPDVSANAKLRVAISVNQAGAGYLGSASHTFVFKPMSVSAAARVTGVRFGGTVRLSGRISSGRARQTVTILARRYGSSAPGQVGTVRTRAGGRWSFRVHPVVRTSYRASWEGASSPPVVVGVRPALTARLLGGGRVHAAVKPAGRFTGRTVELQRRAGSRWRTVARAALGSNGTAVFGRAVRSGRAMVRVAMSVNEAGAGYLGTWSRMLVVHAPGISIAPSGFKVLYGHAVELAGHISSGRSGRRVTIMARAYGGPAPVRVGTATTGAGGSWSFSAKPSLRTTYTARWGKAVSRPVVVGVEPRLAVHPLGDGRIYVQVAAARRLSGRTVELQQQVAAGTWSTIARMKLGRRAGAVFPPPEVAEGTTLRVALSVNEAGAGLLGARSHAFVDDGV